MKGFADRVVAVTGAASGIGRALALELARRGAAVALADLDAEGLAATADNCRARGAPVSVSVLDVGDRAAMTAWAADVAAWQGRVHMVVNNAGVALVAGVEEASDDDLDWLFRTNFWGVVHGTRAFLPHLKAAGEGHVVNISSVFGLVGGTAAVGVLRRQVRSAGLHRVAAGGAACRALRGVGHGRAPRRRAHGDRATGAHRPVVRGARRWCRAHPAPVRPRRADAARARGSEDPGRGRAGSARGAGRTGRLAHRRRRSPTRWAARAARRGGLRRLPA